MPVVAWAGTWHSTVYLPASLAVNVTVSDLPGWVAVFICIEPGVSAPSKARFASLNVAGNGGVSSLMARLWGFAWSLLWKLIVTL